MVLIRIRGELGRIGDRVLNSSYPTSFIPNITQIIGIINAIIGKKVNNYSFSEIRKLLKELEEKVKVRAIYIKKMPKVIDFNILRINHDATKNKNQLTTTIEYQYLYNFEYIIDLEFLDKELENIFVTNLQTRNIKFTPVLGSSECLVDVMLVESIGNFEYYINNKDYINDDVLSKGEIVVLYGYKREYTFLIYKNEL